MGDNLSSGWVWTKWRGECYQAPEHLSLLPNFRADVISCLKLLLHSFLATVAIPQTVARVTPSFLEFVRSDIWSQQPEYNKFNTSTKPIITAKTSRVREYIVLIVIISFNCLLDTTDNILGRVLGRDCCHHFGPWLCLWEIILIELIVNGGGKTCPPCVMLFSSWEF